MAQADSTGKSLVWAILDVILEGSRETIVRKPFAELDDADEEGSPGQLVGDLAQVLLLLLGGLVSIRRHKACSVSGGGDNLFVADRLDTTTGHVLEVLLVVNTRLNCGSMKPVLPSLANPVVIDFACVLGTYSAALDSWSMVGALCVGTQIDRIPERLDLA